jgi:hypothetical protein
LSAPDWRPALDHLGERLAVDIGAPCLPGAPAGQPECTVTEQAGATGPSQTLPRCDRAGPPCWRAVPAQVCPDSRFALQIDRGGCLPPDGTTLTLVCATGR